MLFQQQYLLSLRLQVFPFTHHGGQGGLALNMANLQNVSYIVKEIKPHYIFHLAAHSFTRHEFILENPKAIVDGALAILEFVDRYAPDVNILLASSGLVFKNIGQPVKESN
jgi:GDP-D-mannose dehydratase